MVKSTLDERHLPHHGRGDRRVSKTLTESDVAQFAAISGDFDPIHVDEAHARTTPFGRRIAHGILSMALLSTVSAVIGGDDPPVGRRELAGLPGAPLHAGSQLRRDPPGETNRLDAMPGWSYEAGLAVANNDAVTLPTGYTVGFTINTAGLVSQGRMRSDCADLRVSFVGVTEIELDRLVESCNTSGTVIRFGYAGGYRRERERHALRSLPRRGQLGVAGPPREGFDRAIVVDVAARGAQPEHLAAYRRHARGKTLLRGLGQGRFEDATERTGGAEAGWAWGALATDFDRHGYEELRGFDEFDDTFDVGDKRTAVFSEYQRRAGAVEEKAGA